MLLAPVKHQFLALEGFPQIAGDLFDSLLLGLTQRRAGTGEDIEDRQFFFAEVLAEWLLCVASPPTQRAGAGQCAVVAGDPASARR